MTRSVLTAGLLIHLVNAMELHAIVLAMGWLPTWKVVSWNFSSSSDALRITWTFALGTLAMALGTVLRVGAYKDLGQNFTFELAIRKNHQLVKNGLYAVVRHPGYTGAYVGMAGLAMAHLGPGSLYRELGLWDTTLGSVVGLCQLVSFAYIGVVMLARLPREDAVLREHFGEEWMRWAERTPYRLIPYVY